MKKTLVLGILIVSVLISGCKNPSTVLTASQKADIEKQVLEVWDIITVAVEKADAAGYSAFLSPDEFLAMYSEGTPFHSREAYADSVKTWFGARKSNEINQKSVKVTVLSENLVLLDQVSIFQANFKDGINARLNHTASFVFKKEASGWKIIHGHESWTNI